MGLPPGTPSPAPDNSLEPFAGLLSTLTELLRPIMDDARRMDASLEDAHRLVEQIWRSVFGEGGLLKPSVYKDNYSLLKAARRRENVNYEVLADDVDRYQRRRKRDLSLRQSDDDRFILANRRQDYIEGLQEFQVQADAILTYLRQRPSLP
jgi:hypothetical protein